MDIIKMIAATVVATQFIKKVIEGLIGYPVQKPFAIAIASLTALGVVLVEHSTSSTPITFASVPILIQVVIGALSGHMLIKAASN